MAQDIRHAATTDGDAVDGSVVSAVEAVVRAALAEVNSQLPPEAQVRWRPDAALSGPGSTLGSLGLITLVVALEQRFADTFAVELSLTDAASTARWSEIFATVASLSDHLQARLVDRGAVD